MNVTLLYARIAAALAAKLPLSGCAPIPLPSPVDWSRENLGDSIPNAIEPGKWTREDVLLALGEPDRRSSDDRSFAYESARGLGSVGLLWLIAYPAILPVYHEVRYRAVVVRFDQQGVVTDARLAEHVCSDWTVFNDAWYPCVNLTADVDPVRQMDRLDARATLPTEAGERVHDNFVATVCRRDDHWIDGAVFVTNRAVYFLDRAAEGEPVSRLVFRWRADDIAEIEWGGFDATIGADTARIRHANGSLELLAFKRLPTAGSGDAMTFDRARAERFIATVKLAKDPQSR